MALTIEDGAGVAGADSFITLEEFADIEVDYFGAELPSTDAMREAAIRRSWLYLKSLKWRDEFPTFDEEIPADVKTAQGILARYEVQAPGGLSPSVVPGQQKILTRVGEIGWTATGFSGVDAQRAVVTMAQDLLAPFLLPKTNFLLRA